MKITIHRGTDEIGGSCIEISTETTRILVDIGERLEPVDKSSQVPVNPDAKALPDSLKESLKAEPPIAAILISHAHRDHFGLLSLLPVSLPVYMSEGSEIMLEIAQYFGQVNKVPQKIIPCKLNTEFRETEHHFKIGDITIILFLADHSAMDACSFLFTDGTNRIFYSGDIRAHGRKKIMFDRLVKDPPLAIDALILEGTTLGRSHDIYSSELNLENKFTDLFRKTNDLILVSCSSQNIDRLVTLYRACLKSGKTLVIDPYTAWILEKVHVLHDTVPNWNSPNMAVFYTENNYTELLEKDGHLHMFDTSEIKIRDLLNDRNKIVMKMNFKNGLILRKLKLLRNATLIWSQWKEYFRKDEPFWAREGIFPEYLHASGHAYKKDLQKLAHAMNPTCIIPIHTQHKADYPEIFSPVPVKIVEDGETMEL